MRVIFLNISGMKEYNGMEIGLEFGGDYVKRNSSGGEIYNFQDYNGYCYGYVSTKSGTININRIDDISESTETIDNVLVIWVAKHKKNEKNLIVGWYKNATVYRAEQYLEAIPTAGRELVYYCKAKAEDCFLLPVNQREFPIERARDMGQGKGMGQSNVWFADSDYGRDIFVPGVVDYINNYRGSKSNLVYNNDLLEAALSDFEIGVDKTSVEKMIRDLNDKGNDFLEIGEDLEALRYFNTMMIAEKKLYGSKIPLTQDSDTNFNIGLALRGLNCFDKSIEHFEKVLELEGDTEEVLGILVYLYQAANMDEKALKVAEKILAMLDQDETDKHIAVYAILADIYRRMNQSDKELDLLNKLINIIEDQELKESFINDRNRLSKKKQENS